MVKEKFGKTLKSENVMTKIVELASELESDLQDNELGQEVAC